MLKAIRECNSRIQEMVSSVGCVCWMGVKTCWYRVGERQSSTSLTGLLGGARKDFELISGFPAH